MKNEPDTEPDVETKDTHTNRDVKLLSQGGYGCVYHPSLDCNAKNTGDFKKITKLQIY